MSNYSGKSLVDITEEILLEKKSQENMYVLFDNACAKKGISDEDKVELLAQYYTDLISSAKFVYLGENEWDLKNNQDISLWEKDGSFYKEYNEVEMPEEEEVEPKKEVKPEPVVAEPVVAEPVVEETVEEKPVKVVDTTPKTEVVIIEEADKSGFDEDLFEEEEEYEDDFDEEKYNEYMDTYEDQYED